jgi:hypothetical protein
MDLEHREKHKALNRFLIDDYAMVHINPTAEGVVIPDFLKNSPTVTLKLSKLFRGKLIIEEELVETELLFSGSYFTCKIPFASIWGLTSQQGKHLVWPAAAQEELRAIIEAEQITQTPVATQAKTPLPETESTARPMLKLATKAAELADAEERSKEDNLPSPPTESANRSATIKPTRSRPQLKRIK